MLVAIQGISGSFHHEAADKFFAGNAAPLEHLECDTFRDVFNAVSSGRAKYGVVAVENSLHGPINQVYRLLAQNELQICGEVRLRIELYLIASKEIPLSDCNSTETQVLSHPAALSQCESWLNENLPLVRRIETTDTAQAVRLALGSNNSKTLAVASKRAQAIHDGTILAGPINDDDENYTRFFVLCKQANQQGATRTSIILSETSPDHSGQLYQALGVFANAGISLSKLDSHPLPGVKRRYAFYIDFEAPASKKAAQDSILKLKDLGWNVTVLGTYKGVET